MRAIILPTFENERPLIGQVVELDSGPNMHGEMTAKLLGDTPYIRNNTDGYVLLMPDEFEIIN